ncbi:AimR family lysis-lysogeny pheromone receptor [Shouchella lonarensis]|uniref:Uncharacterized protein n=1 Tax=Shouchella lonarensis TaxID=1464122 RepID=A0A1G6GHQ5_9BACI|nr:AimR family lysis-lysogeny pheromone receptor [Shouchella lonarensis]SDB81285.1 hypothetical protein SAMN05421737_10148 [Shouchella lonarensis]
MTINYAMLFGAETIRRMTKETEVRLAEMDLWKNDKEWTDTLMKKLAREDFLTFDFDQVAYAVKKMAKPLMVELMNEYILSLRSLPHIKDAFEFATVFQQKEVLKYLVDRYENDEHLTEYATVFRLVLRFFDDELTNNELIDEARHFTSFVKDPVMRVRLKLFAADAHCHLGQFQEALLLLEDVVEGIYALEVGYTKSALASRTFLLVGNCFLYGKGSVENANLNYLAVIATNATPDTVKLAANHGMGLVMMCKNDRSQCAFYFEEAIRKAKETGQHAYRECLEREYYPFARNILGEKFGLEGVMQKEQVHQYIVRGEYEKSLRLIEELEAAGKSSHFLTWYKGKATGKSEYFRTALEQFKQGRYMFLTSLIQQELEKFEGLSADVGGDV